MQRNFIQGTNPDSGIWFLIRLTKFSSERVSDAFSSTEALDLYVTEILIDAFSRYIYEVQTLFIDAACIMRL